MSFQAAGLVLASCLLHAFWNLLLKKACDKLAFTALYLLITPLLYLPMFLYLIRRAEISGLGWLCVLGTGVVYFGYFVGLALSYQNGELSIAYPLARGVGPALTLVWGMLLLGERPTVPGAIGVILIILGASGLHWRPGREGSLSSTWTALLSPSSRAAFFVGLMYSFYSLIDKIGVGHLHIYPAVYVYLTYATSSLLVASWVIRRQGRATLQEEWRMNALPCLAVGGLNLFTYLLVLYALSLPNTPVSYIVPLRTTSVLFGVFLGVGVLRESHWQTKVAAAILMMAGIILMMWKG